MPYIFTDFARANVASFGGATIKMALFHQAPSFAQGDARYTGIQTLSDLRGQLGWTEANVAGYPNDAERPVSTLTQSGSAYLMLSDIPLDDDLQPVLTRAIAFYLKGTIGGVVNPVILISTTPVGSGLVLTGGDRIAPRPDTTLGLPLNNSKWIIGWATSNPGNSLVEGALAAQKNPPGVFEPSHTQHAWMYPQRTNFIANPNFEGGIDYWRTNGTKTQIAEAGMGMIGRFNNPGGVVVESNRFPALMSRFTVQMLVRTEGSIRVGLVTWPVEYTETNVDWGNEDWVPSETNFVHIQGLRSAPQPYECMLRIETDADVLDLNNVLVENDYLLDWPYFDGDTTYGARDDYAWYGGENLKGKTFSTWYNNKRATAGRLFATRFPDRAAMTSEDELKEGLTYRWVPAGVIVEPHWDVLFPFDLRHPIEDIKPPVSPYKETEPGTPGWAGDMGIADPWPPPAPSDQLWDSSVGTVGVKGTSGTMSLPLPPLSSTIKRIGSYDNVMASGPYTLNFSPTPAVGDVMLVGVQAAAVVSSSGWTKVGETADAYGNYALYAKVCAGDTGISFSTFTGIYARTNACAFTPNVASPGLAAVHSFQPIASSTQVSQLTTPNLATPGIAKVRMDYVTGHRATSDTPRPVTGAGWYEVYSTGNTANGPSTTGWFARYAGTLPVETGQPWYNPNTNVQASMSWLLDL